MSFTASEPIGSYNNDDILDEFLDQRVYENIGFSPDKLEFVEFYDGSPPKFDDPSPISDQNQNYNYNYNYSDISPSQEDQSFETNDHKQPPRISESGLSYESLRDEIAKLKFGKYDMKVVPDHMEPEPGLLDFSPEAMSNLPYSLSVMDLPDYSRVETQIKIQFNMNPPPPQNLLHIPQDLISKNKFCLYDELIDLNPIILKNLLYMDCYVLSSDLTKSCNVCSKCIKREQKRASRRRLGMEDTTELPQMSPHGIVKNNPNAWADEKMLKKAIIFNCKEIVSFPPPNSLNNSKSIELSARIICYCRHHQENKGFKLLFVIRNFEGKVVAKQLSTNITIMDRKKPMGTGSRSTSVVGSSINVNESSPSIGRQQSQTKIPYVKSEITDDDLLHPISPNSIDESSDLTTNESSSRNLKRKKLSIDDSNHSNNPMYNGSTNGFSPVSNSDTNTSINNQQLGKNVYHKGPARIPDSINPSLSNSPTILRIIPAEGPIRGGIEVTLLGFNFNSNLAVKFGANLALATHCWSDTTMVTYLPPASQPGQVLVTFEDHEHLMTNQQQQIFTYTDDTDKQLIELALQIVGLKMNGKLEDAKNIAKRIVGNDSQGNSNNPSVSNSNAISPNNGMNYSGALEWFSNAQGIVEKLTKLNYSTEDVLINFLKLVDLPNCPIVIPNWQLSNNEGQTLLHLSTIKSYSKLIKFLINHGCKLDLQDNQGLTPLFYASINGQRDLIDLYIRCKANTQLRLSNDKTIMDYCDMNVMDMFSEKSNDDELSNDSQYLQKSGSIDSLNSLFEMKGLHVSKMVPEKFSNESDFADSEFSADYDISDVEDEISFDEGINHDHSFGASGSETSITNETDVIESASDNETDVGSTGRSSGIWQKVKNVFNNSDDDLPTYEDLFPFGPSVSSSKPKSTIERQLNRSQTNKDEAKEELSDSSEEMMISYINHPRKTVENDKMLIFFWVPIMLIIISLFISVSMFGYKFEKIENVKTIIRDGLGNLMVGNERIKRVFSEGVVNS